MPLHYFFTPHKWYLFMIFISSLLVIMSLSSMLYSPSIIMEWQLENMSSSTMSLPLMFDMASSLLMTTVMFITANVMLFSKSYMTTLSLNRFYATMLMFVASMNMFILTPNFMATMIGWDGLGITSFLLVIHYQNQESLGAGLITIFTNRVGDTMILMMIILMAGQGDWSFTSSPPSKSIHIFIIIAAMTKSAQLPFHLWLPEAMAAPTPISALVHSSTLVTAGVFLMIRLYPTLSTSKMLIMTIMNVGAMTTITASLSASSILDPKKIIAYSTMSQLGIMVVSISMGNPSYALFHLITHAMFKALMFLCAGMFISAKSHTQNINSVKATKTMVLTSMSFKLSTMSLNAFPFLGGFFSKDLIIESLLHKTKMTMPLILVLLASMLTTVYSIRLIKSSISVKRNSSHPSYSTHEKEKFLLIPLSSLSLASTVTGSVLLYSMFKYQMPSFISWPHNIIILLTPISGFTLMHLLNSMAYKNKKGPFTSPTNSTLLNQPLHHTLISQSRSNTMSGAGLWNSIIMMSKLTMNLSALIFKHVETTLIELLTPQLSVVSLMFMSKKVIIHAKSPIIFMILLMMTIMPSLTLLIL